MVASLIRQFAMVNRPIMKAHELSALGMNELTIQEQIDLSGGAPMIPSGPTLPMLIYYLIRHLLEGEEVETVDGGELDPAVCEG